VGAVLGLRWGECAGLRVGAIDFLRQTLSVTTQRTRGVGGQMVDQTPKSNAGRRTMAVPEGLMAMLSAHLAAKGLSGADRDAHVFTGPDGAPLEYSNWRQRVWIPACRAAGLEGLRFHDLRRTNLTALVLDGADPKTVQARAGHSDPRLTLAVYAQATTEGDRRAADRLGERFLPKTHAVKTRSHSEAGTR
jgi:integrase